MVPEPVEIVTVLRALGVPVILVLFYLDGAIIGKFAPPAALYVAYVALWSPDGMMLYAIAAACVVASTLGQFTIYRGFNEESPEFIGLRRTLPYVDRVPFVVKDRMGAGRMDTVGRLFDRFGGAGIVVTNVVPGIRCLMAVPAGLSGYPRSRFLTFATLGNVVYLVVLTAVAKGISGIARLFPTL